MTSQTKLVPTASYTSPAEVDTDPEVIDGLIAMLLTMHRWIWRRHETITLLDLTTFTRTTRFEVDLDHIPVADIAGTGAPLGLVPLAICQRDVTLRNTTITDSDGQSLGWTTKDSNEKITSEILRRVKEKSPASLDAIKIVLGAEKEDEKKAFPGGYALIALVPTDGLPRRVITVTQEERVCEVISAEIEKKLAEAAEEKLAGDPLIRLPIKDEAEPDPDKAGIAISHSLTTALKDPSRSSVTRWHRCCRWFRKLFSLRTGASLFFEFDCLADANSIHFEVVAPPETQVDSLDLVWNTVGGPKRFPHEDKGVRAHIFPKLDEATRGSNRGRMAFLHVKIRANDEVFAGAALLLAVFSGILLGLGAFAVGGDKLDEDKVPDSLMAFVTILAIAPALVATFLVRPELNQFTATLVVRLRFCTAVIGAVPIISVSIAVWADAADWAVSPQVILGIGAFLEFCFALAFWIRRPPCTAVIGAAAIIFVSIAVWADAADWAVSPQVILGIGAFLEFCFALASRFWSSLAKLAKRNSGTKAIIESRPITESTPFRALWEERCTRVLFAEVTDACREPLNPPVVAEKEKEKEIWTDATLNEYARTFAAGAGWLAPRAHSNTKAPAITARASVADMASASRTNRPPAA